MLALEHLVKRNLPAGVGSHAAHTGNQARLHATFDFVVRFAVSNGIHQIVPFVLVRVLLIRADLRFPNRVGRGLTLVEAGWLPAISALRSDAHALGPL